MRRFALAVILLALAAPAFGQSIPLSIQRCAAGEYDAVPTCTAVIESDEASAADKLQAYINPGSAYATARDYDSALADETRAIALDPKSGQALADRGFIELQRGLADKAIADFDQMLALGPSPAQGAQVLDGRAAAESAKGETDRAVADYQAALKLEPNDTDASAALARIGARRGLANDLEIAGVVVAMIAIGLAIFLARRMPRARGRRRKGPRPGM